MEKRNGTKAERHTVARKLDHIRNYHGAYVVKETDDGDVWYWGFDEDKGTIYAGGATNAGIIREVEIPYDFDASVDDNLGRIIEAVEAHIAAQAQ